MPEKDVTGRVVELASQVLIRARKALRERVPLGPGNVQLTPAEFRRVWQNVSEGQRAALLQQLQQKLTTAEVLRVLRGKRSLYEEL